MVSRPNSSLALLKVERSVVLRDIDWFSSFRLSAGQSVVGDYGHSEV